MGKKFGAPEFAIACVCKNLYCMRMQKMTFRVDVINFASKQQFFSALDFFNRR
ncbi:hypothetical protein MNBD_ALPHA11-56 [hydrothermal vent metagenome]|uniref:Uncharacterized protein n=1 Tax=hydrothermal vent metagenome TaxID=652676 RepID=A0A3B0TUG3_9ZZZZ